MFSSRAQDIHNHVEDTCNFFTIHIGKQAISSITRDNCRPKETPSKEKKKTSIFEVWTLIRKANQFEAFQKKKKLISLNVNIRRCNCNTRIFRKEIMCRVNLQKYMDRHKLWCTDPGAVVKQQHPPYAPGTYLCRILILLSWSRCAEDAIKSSRNRKNSTSLYI